MLVQPPAAADAQACVGLGDVEGDDAPEPVPVAGPERCGVHCAEAGAAIVGDAIFRESIGRTDLPGGNHPQLISAIRTQIFTLPEETRLLPGDGPETSVGYEKVHNPYLS